MLWFRKKHKKEARLIGENLHHQIYTALKVNTELADSNLRSDFVVGYLYYFVASGFAAQGIPASTVDKYLKFILDGVLPGKLWALFNSQLGLIELEKQRLAKDGADDDEQSLFSIGGKAGMSDGLNLVSWDRVTTRDNLRAYLLGEDLDYKDWDDDILTF